MATKEKMETDGNDGKPIGNNGNREVGNSKTSRAIPGRYWIFTYFYKNKELETLETNFKDKGVEYFYGLEKCPTTGKEHAQGYCEFPKKTRPLETIKIEGIHWIKAKGSKEANIKYCGKDGDIKTNMYFRPHIIDPLFGKILKPWQKSIIDLVEEEPDRRTIYWFYGTKGAEGKTSLAKSVCIRHPKRTLYLGGKAADVRYAVHQFIDNKDNYALQTVFFDYTRTQEGFISYEALESIKNGIFFSTKYECQQVIFNSPHVICFANYPPDTDKLSHDRMKIFNITEEEHPDEEDDTDLEVNTF